MKYDLKEFSTSPFVIIGNFPYNISSQIFFKVLENKELVVEVVGMIQKEVAERIAAPPGSKTYGILSVLLQAYYDIKYLFTVNEQVFSPPPNVKSAVIRLTRNSTTRLDCDEALFLQIVKAGFNQRRKMLRNSLKAFIKVADPTWNFLQNRPEQLSVKEFVEITNLIQNQT
jgi:16S rRNA (adenine1518-N6/adenine1519-N6)-dimethyltransferase